MAAFGANGSSIDGFPITSLAVDEPSGSTDGQLMVIQGFISDATGIAATGWNITVHPVVVGGVDYDFVVLWRIRSGSASTTVSWTNSGYGDLTMHRFSGVHASTPVESITAGTATTSANKVAPSVNSTYTNSLLADFYIEDDFNSWTPDAAFTERFDGGASYGTGMSTLQLSASGATGTHTHVSVNATGGIVVRMVIVDASPIAGATLEQEGFAFGDDDGNEASHTLDTQDTNVTEALGVKTLRMLLNATDDPASSAFKLKYQKNGSGGYADVPTAATTPGQTGAIEVGDVTEDGNNTASGTWGVAHPAAATGDLLIFHLAWDDSTTTTDVSAPSGPNGETAVVIEGPTASDATAVRGKIFYYIATGSWSAGDLNFTPTANEQWTSTVLKVLAGEFDSSTPIGASNDLASTGVSDPSLPSLTAGGSDGGGRVIGWVASDTDDADGSITGWTSLSSVDRGAVGGDLLVRDTVATDSESISAATGLTFATDRSWVSFIYIIRPPADVTNEVYISASANVTAGGENTTARLTAPSGKTTSDFDTGRRWDDENGSDSIDITADDYTELEWVLTTQSPATTSDYFDFRVYNGNTALNTYTVTPRWTIGSGSTNVTPTPGVITSNITVVNPTVTAVRNVTVTPSPVTLSLSIIAPTVRLGASYTSGVVDLSLSQPAATVTTTRSTTQTIAVQNLTASIPPPTVTTTRSVTTSPEPIGLTLSQIAPTITAIQNDTITPDPISLSLSVQNPTLQTTESVSPAPITSTISVVAPTVTAVRNNSTSPNQIDSTLTIVNPTVTTTRNVTALPNQLDLSLSIIAPAISTVRNATVSPEPITLTTSIIAPTVSATRSVTVSPDPINLSLSIVAPIVTAVRNTTISPNPVPMTLSVEDEIVSTAGSATVTPNTVNLALSIIAPTVTPVRNVTITPDPIALSISVQTPSIATAGNVTVNPNALNLTLSQIAPTVTAVRNTTITPDPVTLSLSSQNQTVSVTDTTSPSAVDLSIAVVNPTVTTTRSVTTSPNPTILTLSLPSPTVDIQGETVNVTVTPGVIQMGAPKFINVDGKFFAMKVTKGIYTKL